MRYYLSGNNESLDLLGIIRKIRTNSLKKTDLISSDENENPIEAYQHSELYELFVEQDRILQEESYANDDAKQGIGSLLKHGIGILKDDMSSAAITGTLIIVAMAIVGGAALELPYYIGALITPVIIYFIFNLCLIAHLRLSRVQLLSSHLIIKTCKNYGKDLLIISLIPALLAFSIPWVLSHFIGWKVWVFALILITPIIAYFFYLPVIIFDREMNFKQAFALNHQVIRRLGMDLFIPIIAMIFINIIVGPFILLTLPITFLAAMQLYDNHFVEY